VKFARNIHLLAWLAAILAALPPSASACATCFGDPKSTEVQAMNVGILMLLCICGCVLGVICVFIGYLNQKSKQLNIEGPGDLGIPRAKEAKALHD
jgi:hypothetical protein